MTKTQTSINFYGVVYHASHLNSAAFFTTNRRQPCKLFPEITLYFGQFTIVLTFKF